MLHGMVREDSLRFTAERLRAELKIDARHTSRRAVTTASRPEQLSAQGTCRGFVRALQRAGVRPFSVIDPQRPSTIRSWRARNPWKTDISESQR
eukprot:7385132-Prymnesium_polylepis.1